MSQSLGRGARGRRSQEWEFAVVALALVTPLFVSRYLPIQDLPQHVAAVRVLSDFSNPVLGFREFFELVPLETPYWTVYALALPLAWALGPVLAVKIVLGIALVGTPYALRALLRVLGKPDAYALFAVPLAYNAHVLLGFVNFALGLPLMLFGIALAIELRQWGERRTWCWFSGVACATFLSHVVPYAVLVIGAGALFLERDARRCLVRFLALVPSLVLALLWLALQPSGRHLLGLLHGGAAEYQSFGESLSELPSWLIDVFRNGSGLWILVGTGWAAAFVLGARTPRARSLDLGLERRLLGVLAIGLLGYFALPVGYAWIWPLNARLSIICALLAVALLPPIAARARRVLGAGLLLLSCAALGSVFVAFAVGRREYEGLAELIERLPPGRRVAGLIFRRDSQALAFSPYLHAVAWYQVERGGAVLFTFADFPQSPFRFRAERRPPPVPARWEWLPHRVRTERDLDFYEYLICRGAASELPGWTRLDAINHWSVWTRAR